MRRKIFFMISIILSLSIGIFIGYKTYQNKHPMHIYKLNTITNDSLIILENMKFISCGTNLCVEPNFIIRKHADSNFDIELIKLNITIGKNTIPNLNLTLGTKLNKEGYISDDTYLLKDIIVDNNSTVTVHFTYTIDGETYESCSEALLQQEY